MISTPSTTVSSRYALYPKDPLMSVSLKSSFSISSNHSWISKNCLSPYSDVWSYPSRGVPMKRRERDRHDVFVSPAALPTKKPF